MTEQSLITTTAPLPPAPAASPVPGFPSAEFDEEASGRGFSAQRLGRALLRYKWLMMLAAAIAAAAGYATWRVIDPDYVAEGNLWVEPGEDGAMSPISESDLLGGSAWIELLRSFSVLDPVVQKERLYLETTPNWSWLFAEFALSARFRPGQYRLAVQDDGRSWKLFTGEGVELETGNLGDPIGKTVGFEWRLGPRALQEGAVVNFTVVPPRDASRKLGQELGARMEPRSNFIGLTLRGKDPVQISSVLNSLMKRHVELAAELKRRKLDERRAILEEQLTYAQEELERAERELEAFRVATVTLPSETAPPIAAGLAQTRDPVFNSFFEMKIQQESLARDRQRLRELLAGSGTGPMPLEALEMVPSVRQSAQLAGAIDQLVEARAQVRALAQRYQDEYRPMQDLRAAISELETETIPAQVDDLANELEERESELASRISAASANLSNIPVRTIEEARLSRQVGIQETLYNDLRLRVETARLASASSIPDVSILDEARTPQVPANDERVRMMLMVALGVLCLGAAGAIALDRMDPTLRDPAELPGEIGLAVLGAVPKIGGKDPFNEARVLEAFRELRMHLEFAHGRGPLVVTISSASQAEGKSLVSANLALIFAEMGRRTLLVDGDTRRGDVNELLATDRKPGLTDYLAGLEYKQIVQATRYPKLDFIGSGSRKASSPELLASTRMRELFSLARTRYEVVIVDSPPLTAGADAALLAALAGSLAVVVRSGTSQREMVLAKLEGLRRFPIRVLGGILNDFAETGRSRYLYYSNYLPGYEATSEDAADERRDLLVASSGKTEPEPAT